jgi:hypothetical protein
VTGSDPTPVGPPNVLDRVATGAAAWIALALLALGPARARLGWLELLLLLGVLVVAPLSLGVLLGPADRRRATIARRIQPIGVGAAVASLLVARGWTSASLASASAVVAAFIALLFWEWPFPGRPATRWAVQRAVGLLSPVLGSIALACWRGHVRFGGLGGLSLGLAALVLLLVGVGMVALATLVSARRTGNAAVVTPLAVAASVPLLVLGLAGADAAGVIGGIVLAPSVVAVGILSIDRARKGGPMFGKLLLLMSGLAALASTALAGGWALGRWLGDETPTLVDAVRIDGTLFGLGVAVTGLTGWTLQTNDRPARSS